MQRTVITATKDGSLLVTLEARVGISGSSQQRRKKEREGIQETWRTVDRVISAELPFLPKKAEEWPGLARIVGTESSEVGMIAAENEQVTQRFTQEAAETKARIDAYTLTIDPPKRFVVVFVEEKTQDEWRSDFEIGLQAGRDTCGHGAELVPREE